MKNLSLASFRKRLVLLGLVAVLLVGLFVQRKLTHSWQAWQQVRASLKEERSLGDLQAEIILLEGKLASLDRVLGGATANGNNWQHTLDLLAALKGRSQVSLAGVAEEHVIDHEGMLLRTLPLSLSGRTDELVNAIDLLEREGGPVHLLAVDLFAKRAGFNKPRVLTATLYLQTISR